MSRTVARSVRSLMLVVVVAASVVVVGPAPLHAAETVTATFNYSGGAQTFTVPTGVYSVTIDANGAQGGGNCTSGSGQFSGAGAWGGHSKASVAVTAGQILQVFVGGQPDPNLNGGFNGGGNGGCGGGGASDVRRGGTGLNNRIIVAGGGGGAAVEAGCDSCTPGDGGSGGGSAGSAGTDPSCGCGLAGGGGTQTGGGGGGTGGTADGTGGNSGTGGTGGLSTDGQTPPQSGAAGGGGGGGYFGGGGGGALFGFGAAFAGGGGGGSGFNGTLASETGVHPGAGLVTISYVTGFVARAVRPEISAGQVDSCAVVADGTARCWGRNDFGQLGNGTTTDSLAPVVVSGLTNVAAIDAGSSHSCAVLGNGTVKCWGSNNFGQLGNGGTTDSHTPVLVTGLGNVVAVEASNGSHTCALLSNGTVKCWGHNSFGELGNGTTTNAPTSTPVLVSGLTGAVAISVGGEFSCAALANGTAKCWGLNSSGQLGNGTTANSSTPVVVGGTTTPLANVVAVSAGNGAHACAALSNGTAKCWGRNDEGQLGNGTLVDSSTPLAVSGGLTGVVAISAGGIHSCAMLSNGTAKCWGRNAEGQLGSGNGNFTDSNVPVIVSGLTNAVAISAGGFHTCVLVASGVPKCWGYNGNGGLGNGGATGNSPIPVNVSGITGLNSGAPISAGYQDGCAVLGNGTARCWGRNDFGQLGNGTTTNAPLPVLVSGLTNVVATDAGTSHGCAMLGNGTVKCWGRNNFGQLGNGGTTDSHTPVMVTGLGNVLAISASTSTSTASHTCALLSNGTVKCWGRNSFGELGNGTTTDSSAPVLVGGSLTNVVAISVGGPHSCAALANGTVKCWGLNSSGQLGNGTTANSSTPVLVGGSLTNAVAISAGETHSCATLSNGNAKCWGSNVNGGLGNGGSTGNSSTPVNVRLTY